MLSVFASFSSQYTNAVRSNSVNDFINFYQSIDVLLLTVYRFGRENGYAEYIFPYFQSSSSDGKAVGVDVRSSSRFARRYGRTHFDPFQVGTFGRGWTTDYDLRKNILLNKLKKDGIVIAPDVVDFIARNVSNSIRELEGIIVSLMARSIILKKEISVEMAECVLASSIQLKKKQITIELIQQKVCDYYNMDVKLLQSKTRKREIALARQISMYLAKKYTEYPLSHIGSRLGGKDHGHSALCL